MVAVVVLGAAVLTRLGDQLEARWTARCASAPSRSRDSPPPRRICSPSPARSKAVSAASALLVQVVDRRGRIVARSSGLGSRVLPETDAAQTALADRRAGYGDAQLGPDPVRLYAAPLGELGRGSAAGGAVIVAGHHGRDGRHARHDAPVRADRGALRRRSSPSRWRRRSPTARWRRCGASPRARAGSSAAATPPGASRSRPRATRSASSPRPSTRMLASLQRAREAEQRFVGDASHELRTPLTALRGNAAYIDPPRPGPGRARRHRGRRRAPQRAARRPSGAGARGRRRAGARRAGRPRRDRARGRRRRRPHEATGTPAPVLGERPALERAVGNLVGNARKHGPPDGRSRVTTGIDGDRARIAVEDEGPGLPPGRPPRCSSASGAGRAPAARAPASASRSCARSPSATAAPSTVERSRFTIELPALTDLSTARP